jgi:hypothetical protein
MARRLCVIFMIFFLSLFVSWVLYSPLVLYIQVFNKSSVGSNPSYFILKKGRRLRICCLRLQTAVPKFQQIRSSAANGFVSEPANWRKTRTGESRELERPAAEGKASSLLWKMNGTGNRSPSPHMLRGPQATSPQGKPQAWSVKGQLITDLSFFLNLITDLSSTT